MKSHLLYERDEPSPCGEVGCSSKPTLDSTLARLKGLTTARLGEVESPARVEVSYSDSRVTGFGSTGSNDLNTLLDCYKD